MNESLRWKTNSPFSLFLSFSSRLSSHSRTHTQIQRSKYSVRNGATLQLRTLNMYYGIIAIIRICFHVFIIIYVAWDVARVREWRLAASHLIFMFSFSRFYSLFAFFRSFFYLGASAIAHTESSFLSLTDDALDSEDQDDDDNEDGVYSKWCVCVCDVRGSLLRTFDSVSNRVKRISLYSVSLHYYYAQLP